MRKRHILIVEDDEAISEAFGEILMASGFDVKTALNGQLALKLLDEANSIDELPDLILLDFLMPIMNGAQFISKLREQSRYETIKIVVLSALADKNQLPENTLVLNKPIDLNELFKVFRNVFEDLTIVPWGQGRLVSGASENHTRVTAHREAG